MDSNDIFVIQPLRNDVFAITIFFEIAAFISADWRCIKKRATFHSICSKSRCCWNIQIRKVVEQVQRCKAIIKIQLVSWFHKRRDISSLSKSIVVRLRPGTTVWLQMVQVTTGRCNWPLFVTKFYWFCMHVLFWAMASEVFDHGFINAELLCKREDLWFIVEVLKKVMDFVKAVVVYLRFVVEMQIPEEFSKRSRLMNCEVLSDETSK